MSNPNVLAQLLKQSRARHRISQLEISLRLGVSQRHVSFIESARALPGRALLLAWMSEVQAEASLRNAALLQAGYALDGIEPDCASSQTRQAVAALRQVLALHEPNAGLVFDADWLIVELNRGARALCRLLMPGLGWSGGPDAHCMDMIEALRDPRGLLSRARQPECAAAALLAQLRIEQWARPTLRERVNGLADELERRFDLPETPSPRHPALPYLELAFDSDRGPLSFALVQTVLGLPHDVTVGSLRTELWYPADEPTAAVMRALAAAGDVEDEPEPALAAD
jgi:transcriptional regulator with XRE-family HTH domain